MFLLCGQATGQTLWPQTQITSTTFGNNNGKNTNNIKFAMQTSQVKRCFPWKNRGALKVLEKCADLHVGHGLLSRPLN